MKCSGKINKFNFFIFHPEWFEDKNEYLNLVRDSNIFFAPRLYEGIGMSFLEAMSMGKCVVAPGNPTMNEYITHNKTGLLYDPNDPQPLDFSIAESLGKNARKYIEESYKKWNFNKNELMNFIETPCNEFIISYKNKIRSYLITIFSKLMDLISVCKKNVP